MYCEILHTVQNKITFICNYENKILPQLSLSHPHSRNKDAKVPDRLMYTIHPCLTEILWWIPLKNISFENYVKSWE